MRMNTDRSVRIMYTLETCTNEWAAAGNHGPVSERIERMKRWLPYYACLAKRQLGKAYAPSETAQSFVSELVRVGLLRPEDHVLDIGAGMGGYALELAKHCAKVTALEPSQPCLDVLMERGEICGISERLEPVCGIWEEYHPQERYDLVFASMCPAICDPEELRRMEAMSRRGCCIVTVMRGSVDRHRSAMMAALSIRPKGGMVTEAIHYYQALYLMGRCPNVVCKTEEQSYVVSENTILTQYPVYFRIFDMDEDSSLPFLKQYLKEYGENGGLREESRLLLAMITWRV